MENSHQDTSYVHASWHALFVGSTPPPLSLALPLMCAQTHHKHMHAHTHTHTEHTRQPSTPKTQDACTQHTSIVLGCNVNYMLSSKQRKPPSHKLLTHNSTSLTLTQPTDQLMNLCAERGSRQPLSSEQLPLQTIPQCANLSKTRDISLYARSQPSTRAYKQVRHRYSINAKSIREMKFVSI